MNHSRLLAVFVMLFGGGRAVWADAIFTTIDAPPPADTVAVGNAPGGFVESSTDASGRRLLDSIGSFALIGDLSAEDVLAAGINASGQTMGYVKDGAGASGFLHTAGPAIDAAGAHDPRLFGIDSIPQIVGYFFDGAGAHGFLYSAGAFTAIDGTCPVQTIPCGIHAMDQVVGSFYDGVQTRGFTYYAGVFTMIDDPGTSSVPGNDENGKILGYSQGELMQIFLPADSGVPEEENPAPDDATLILVAGVAILWMTHKRRAKPARRQRIRRRRRKRLSPQTLVS